MAACYCNRCTSCIYDGWGDSECGSLEQSLTPERIVDGVFRLGELPRTTVVRHSGAGMNMKVGAPVRSKSGGGTDPERSTGNFFGGLAPPLFGSKSTISRFGERFRDGQYSLVISFLFAVLSTRGASRAQPFVKVGARAPVPHGVGATGQTYSRV